MPAAMALSVARVLVDWGSCSRGATKAAAMKRTNKVAIARVVLRSKEQLVAIRPSGDVLMMETMLFHDEVVPSHDIEDLPDGKELKATDRELKMAQQLIDSLSSEFDPTSYHDEYREKVLELIERKAAGEEIVRRLNREGVIVDVSDPKKPKIATEAADVMDCHDVSFKKTKDRVLGFCAGAVGTGGLHAFAHRAGVGALHRVGPLGAHRHVRVVGAAILLTPDAQHQHRAQRVVLRPRTAEVVLDDAVHGKKGIQYNQEVDDPS